MSQRDDLVLDLRTLLLGLGEDPSREGFERTGIRAAEAWEERLRGYTLDPREILATTFENEDEPGKGLQLIEDIFFSSTCEHHWLPFTEWCSVAYIPSTRVVGLSKVVRVVDCFAQRMQIQERMTAQIADALYGHEELAPRGVAVVVSAKHVCCLGRGVKREGMNFVTTTRRGAVEMQLLQTMTQKIRRA